VIASLECSDRVENLLRQFQARDDLTTNEINYLQNEGAVDTAEIKGYFSDVWRRQFKKSTGGVSW